VLVFRDESRVSPPEEALVDKADTKEPYEPPDVLRVKLVSDELAVIGCKTLKGAGPASTCLRTMCKNVGS
jgi:hypothetical protein